MSLSMFIRGEWSEGPVSISGSAAGFRRPRVLASRGMALIVAACALMAMSALSPGVARADGDPASDYLSSQSVFLPAGASAAQRAELARLTELSTRTGSPIKVAVIGSAYDLGSVTPVWRKPQEYARFLGAELSYVYRGRLLVVMPNGFGIYDGKRSVTAEQRVLSSIPIRPGLAGLLAAADAATRGLASADGHQLPASGGVPASVPDQPKSSHGGNVFAIIVLAVGIALIAAAWTVSLRLRPSRRLRFTWRTPRPMTKLMVVLVPIGLVMGGVAAVVAPFGTSGAAPAQPPRSNSQGFTWPAGSRPAPAFTLRDQGGRPISLRSLRGRIVILAFVDPVCRNFCPLEASLIGDVERALSPQSRPAVVAVSVNPWGNAPSHLRQDARNWRVGDEWRWAVGSHAELARVWRAYKIGVQIKKLTVAGAAVHEISHTDVIYLIDRHGDERQVIPYPFTAAAVLRGVRQLEPA